MAEVITGEFSKYTSTLIDAHAASKVWLWDCGPEKPKQPVRPDEPHGKKGDPDYELAVIEWEEVKEKYADDMKRFRRMKEERAAWETHMGGPIERMMWSVDARDALANDARAVQEGRQSRLRYYISSRTRGYEKLKNRGLPIGLTPGHGHQAEVERQIAGDKEFVAALKADPQFGQEIRA